MFCFMGKKQRQNALGQPAVKSLNSYYFNIRLRSKENPHQ